MYIGGLLERFTRGGLTEHRHYIPTGSDTSVVYARRSDGTSSTYYVSKDHLGSASTITDASGAVLVRPSFGAFGERRGASWQGVPSSSDWAQIGATTPRGFTDHEHLDGLSLIHMNGRVYDPQVGRFISGDPFVQAPFDGQSFNRYAYVFNNPLTFVDPSGFLSTPGGSPDAPRWPDPDDSGIGWEIDFTNKEIARRERARLPHLPTPHRSDVAQDGVLTAYSTVARSDPDDRILPSFGRGFLGSYRSVIDGPAPSFEQLGRSSRQTLDNLVTVVSIGLLAVPGGQAGSVVLTETRLAGAVAGSIRNVNPLRSVTNCVNCAIATDAILAGRATSALASGATQISVLETLYGSQFVRVSGQQAVEALLMNAGSGARGIVYGSRGAGEIGHVFNAINQNGTIRFLDGQIGGAASFEGYVEFFFLRTF